MSQISQTRLKEILEYNPLTGDFIWKVKIADKVVVGTIAGTINDAGYRIIRIDGKKYRAHQLAFLYMENYFPLQVDHGNHIKNDNVWTNLSAATYSSNGKNQPKTRRNKTGVVGVSIRPDNKFVARIYLKGRHIFLGVFKTLEEAKSARDAANIENNFHPNHGT